MTVGRLPFNDSNMKVLLAQIQRPLDLPPRLSRGATPVHVNSRTAACLPPPLSLPQLQPICPQPVFSPSVAKPFCAAMPASDAPGLCDLLQTMLTVNPAERTPLATVLQHPWLAQALAPAPPAPMSPSLPTRPAASTSSPASGSGPSAPPCARPPTSSAPSKGSPGTRAGVEDSRDTASRLSQYAHCQAHTHSPSPSLSLSLAVSLSPHLPTPPNPLQAHAEAVVSTNCSPARTTDHGRGAAAG